MKRPVIFPISILPIVFAISILLLCVLTGCHKPDNLHPFGWQKITPAIDSVTLALENSWLADQPLDSLNTLVTHLEQMAANTDDAEVSLRAKYWRGRYELRSGNVGTAYAIWQEAQSECDSALNPYIYHRLVWSNEDYPLAYTLDGYNTRMNQAQYFEKAGDYMLGAAEWTDVAMISNDLGNFKRAESLLDHADSLARIGGFDDILQGNKLNRANVLLVQGRTDEFRDSLYSLLADSAFLRYPGHKVIVLTNLYYQCNDSDAIVEAYVIAKDEPMAYDQFPGIESAYAEVLVNRGRVEEALPLVEHSLENLDRVPTRAQRQSIYGAVAEVRKRQGQLALADSFRLLQLESFQNIFAETRRGELQSHMLNEEIARAEHQRDMGVARARLLMLGGISLALLLILCGWFIAHRRINRHRLKSLQAKLALEKAQRHHLATQIALDERESLIENIRNQLVNSSENQFSRQQLETAIRTHTATGVDRNILEAFAEVHPEFDKRLRTLYPALSEADHRLLALIAVGLTNKEIATTLGIRPESVKQSRWRLRNKMNLAQDETIEKVISQLTQD